MQPSTCSAFMPHAFIVKRTVKTYRNFEGTSFAVVQSCIPAYKISFVGFHGVGKKIGTGGNSLDVFPCRAELEITN